MKPVLLFLTLKVFCETGGIEKVSRLAGKALYDLSGEGFFKLLVHAAYDDNDALDEKYFPAAVFKGFGGSRIAFVLQSLRAGTQASVVLLSHINLLSVGYAIKKLSPGTKLVLLAHGIEVWQPLPAWRRRMLKACDLVLPVSEYTRKTMIGLHGLDATKLTVVNNCLDPFLPVLVNKEKSKALLQQYGFSEQDKILFTLSRLSSKERYKGYDEVLMALKSLLKEEPALRYLIVGKYDNEEKQRLDRIVTQQGLTNAVVFAGFVPDDELAEHFNLADVYVMPSRKEGFGIVFIEALFYGKPVIAGNVDGSVDALAGGKLGLLVNPDRPEEIKAAIKKILGNLSSFLPDPEEVRKRFSYTVYKEVLSHVFAPFITAQKITRTETTRLSQSKSTDTNN